MIFPRSERRRISVGCAIGGRFFPVKDYSRTSHNRPPKMLGELVASSIQGMIFSFFGGIKWGVGELSYDFAVLPHSFAVLPHEPTLLL